MKPLTQKQLIKRLGDLEALTHNPAFENWIYHQFYSGGFAPVAREPSLKLIKSWRKALNQAINELGDK